MQLTSPAFPHQGVIPEEHAFAGKNKNPPLAIGNVPERAVSLALIMHDPNAWGGCDFLHWIVWNMPKDATFINENTMPEGTIVGLNDKRKVGYIRPTPLKNSGTHHYIFELYALDSMLEISQDTNRLAVEAAINAHVIEKTELIGVYER